MDIYNLLNRSIKKYLVLPYFYGHTKKTYLIGPEINKRTCFNCLKLRLLSSSFYDKEVYLPTSIHTQKIISEVAGHYNLINKIIELDKKSYEIIFIHHLLSVPGCREHISK